MKRIVKADRHQCVLFQRTIADSLPEGHEIFVFEKLIDSLDLTKFYERYSNQGGKAYDPRIMLSILIYGYHRGWRSSRELQRACEENMPMRYLTGDQRVKFRAIADFRVRFAEEIADIFCQSVAHVVKRQASVGEDIKVDGTKISSYAANDQTYTKAELKARLAEKVKSVMDYLQGGIEDDKREDALLGDEAEAPIDWEETERRLTEIAKQQRQKARENMKKKPEPKPQEDKPSKPVDERQSELFATAMEINKIRAVLERAKDMPETTKLNLTDPDSRFMKNGGKITQSYNVQVASSEGFIVDADIATDNKENDMEELVPVLERAEANVGRTASRVTADAGYFHAKALEFIDNKKIDGYIPSPRQVWKERQRESDTGYESHYFRYDSNSKKYICPKGNPLELARQFERDGKHFYSFRCKPIYCMQCSARYKCCTTKEDMRLGYRSLELGESHELKHAMIVKMQTEEAKNVYKKRGAEIEPIFGTWKASKKFRQFLLRGRDKVRIEVKLIAIAFNFGKLAKMALA